MKAIGLAGCVVAVLVLCLGGCGNKTQTAGMSSGRYQEVDVPVELVAKARPPIADLPIPVGFKLDEKRSRNFAAAGARYVDHLYKGRADKWIVARFYKRQMPTRRWTYVTDIFAQGDIRLDFEKETERCQIIIARGSLFHPTYIKVQSWTTGRIMTPEVKTGKGATGK